MHFDFIFARYIFVGVMNTVFGYTVFALFVFLGLHYSIALFFATVIGIVFNFKTLGLFVFDKTNWNLIWRFLAVYGILYGVNVLCVFVMMFYIHNVYIASAFALVIVAFFGFFLNRTYVYATD